MKTIRLMTLLSIVALGGALLTPTLASAHGPRDHWRQDYNGERWSSSPPKRSKWHHRHRDYRDQRDYRDRRDHRNYRSKIWIHADRPRLAPRPFYPDRSVRYRLGNGVTIIYR